MLWVPEERGTDCADIVSHLPQNDPNPSILYHSDWHVSTALTSRWDFANQCKFNLGGEGLLVVGGLDEDDDGSGHCFSQLVRSYRVVLQGKVGKDHEPAEAQSQPHNPANRKAFWSKNIHFLAEVESQPGDHKVNEGQGHVGEAIVYVDPFVDEDDTDGGEQVDQQASNNALVG